MIRALVILLLMAGQANAGAWPREAGETFLSFAIEINPDDGANSFATLYLEHGLKHDLTLGLDAGGHEDDMSKAIGFLRWPIGRTDGNARIALEFGAGLSDGGFALRPGLSWGRGLTWGELPGWLSVETRALLLEGFDGRAEVDVTFGLKPTPRSKIMIQLQTAAPTDKSPSIKLSPSWAYEMKPGRHVTLGVTAGVVEAEDMHVSFGIWQRF